MKLGFAIKIISAGAGEPVCVNNKGQWIRKIGDRRDFLKLFSGLQETANKLTFLTLEEDGCFLTVMRSVAGRLGDSVSAWIYIPNSIRITGEEMCEVHDYVCGLLDKSDLSASEHDIQDFFSRTYPDKEKCVPNRPSQGEKFAIQYTTDERPLADLLGEKRCQPAYSNYKAVFFLPENGTVKVAAGQFEDLTGVPLQTYCILEVPDKALLQAMGKNVSLYLENKTKFDKDIPIGKGAEVRLTARRSGFSDIKLPPFKVTDEVQKVPPQERPLNWKVLVTARMFRICDGDGNDIPGASIEIGGRKLPFNGPKEIPESEFPRTRYTVKANGYEDFSDTFSDPPQTIQVSLRRPVNVADFNLILANGAKAGVEIKTRGVRFHGDSIKGYSYDSKKEAYDLDTWFVWKERLKGALCLIVLCAALVLGIKAYHWYDENVRFGGGFPWGHIEKQKTPSDSLSATLSQDVSAAGTGSDDASAAAYLDGNSIWQRDSLENHSATQGLFDFMNTFDWNGLEQLEYSAPVPIKESSNFKKLMEAVRTCLTKGLDPASRKADGTYNRQNDTKIDLKNYISFITRKPENKSGGDVVRQPQQQGNKADKAKQQPSGSRITNGGKSSGKSQVSGDGAKQTPQRGGTSK